MKIGFLMQYSVKDAEFAAKHGFKSIELLVSPGSELDPDSKDSEKRILSAKEKLADCGIEVSSIGYYVNHLNPDLKERQKCSRFLVRLFDLCEKMEVRTVATFAGREPEKDIPDNIPAFKKVFSPIVRKAEDRGIKIAFENCPMFHYFPFRGINIAYTPRAWELMFDAIPSESVGLEYDPSHLICLLIDYIEVVHRYGSRIFHVHAKDAEVIWRDVHINGILEPGAVRHRIPGYGDVDWGKLVSALVEAGYRGNLDIEGRHDPVFCGEKEEEGLLLALKHLSQFVTE